MPNWCENKLSVENVTPEFIEYLKAEGFSFEKMAKPDRPENDDSGFATVSAQADAWGTKWDLSESEQKEVADCLVSDGVATFDTAWSPPIEAINALSKKFPEVKFRLAYYEGGVFFWGLCDIEEGHGLVEETSDGSLAAAREFLQEHMGYDEESAAELVWGFGEE